MKRLLVASLAAFAFAVVPAASVARAQMLYPQTGVGMQPYGQRLGAYTTPVPPVSPFINMANGNPAVSYFGITVPQLQMQGQLGLLGQQLAVEQTTLGAAVNAPLTTGHAVRFMDTRAYFMRLPMAAAAPGGVTAPLYAPTGTAAAGLGAGGPFGAPYRRPSTQTGYR